MDMDRMDRGRLGALLGALAVAGGAWGQPIAAESFEYSPPGLMLPEYDAGGAGWRFPWDGNWRTAAGSLRYASGALQVDARGNKVRGTSAESQRIMELEAPLGAPGTRVWVTMLGKQTAGTAANTFAGLRLPTGQSTFIYMGKPYGLPGWGLDGGPGTPKLQSAVPATEESLLVMRIDFRAGADDVYLWVNPPLNAEPTPATASIAAPGYNDFNNITKVLMEMGSVGSSIEAEFDEVRVGRTWQDAMAMVPPATLCVTPRSLGGCCYEFDLGQENGGVIGFPGVEMTLPPGTTVRSATTGSMPAGSTVTYTPGGTTVRWDLPSGITMNGSNVCLVNFNVSVCFDSVTSGATTATFDAVGGSYLGPVSLVLSGPTCTYSQAGCCDTWAPTGFAGQPGAPVNAAMVYDEGNQVTVLWGGMDCLGVPQSGLWVRRDNIWRRETPIPGNSSNGVPAARQEHAMAYDPLRRVVVMYGGCNAVNTGVRGDLWELRFDGTDWVWDLKTPAVTPGPLYAHAMAYDPISREVLVMGGLASSASAGSALCWGWNGAAFTPRAPMASAAAFHAAALDESRQTIVVLSAGAVEEYRNGAWSTPAAAPPPGLFRFDAAMAYDSACGRMIIHGGWDFSTPNVLSDAWSYDGAGFSSMAMPVRPQGRSQHCMSWDKRLQRVVMYGGYDGFTSTCTDNTWHFDSGYSTVVGRGWSDGFSAATVEPPPALAPAFLAARPLLSTAVFDQTVNNKTFGVSFGIPWRARGKITKAVLEFRARPLSGDASNDTFGLSDFSRTGGGLWSTSFASLPATGGGWSAGHAPTTFLLDLSALPVYSAGVLQPGTYNMLADLNAGGSWPDLFVQDDTAVDYARLHLWTCPRASRWGGFDVSDLGSASSAVTGAGQLRVTGFGAGPGSGVEIDLGNAGGADLHWSTPAFSDSPVGAMIDIAAFGSVDGAEGAFIARTHAVKTAGDRTAFTCDAGAPTNTVELYSDGALVAVVPGVPRDQPCMMIGQDWHVDWHCNDPAHILFVWNGPTFDNPALTANIGAGFYPGVDFIKFTPEAAVPPVASVQSVVVTAAGLSEIVFDDAAVRMFDAEFRGVDGGTVRAETASVIIGRGGSDGSGGAVKSAVAFPAAGFVSVDCVPFDEGGDLALLGADWGVLLASFSASGGDLPPGPGPAVSFRSDTGTPPDGQGTWVAQEFTVPPGIACIAYNGPTAVATFTPAQAASVRVDRLPGRVGWTAAPSGGHGLFCGFPAGARLHAPGPGLIDITSLVWDGGPGAAARIGGVTIEAGELTDRFTVTGVSFAAPCPADFNGDDFVDFFDYDGFVGAFEVGDPSADFNQDGFLDFFDYDGFVQAFEVGC